jgi:hypothetical protein
MPLLIAIYDRDSYSNNDLLSGAEYTVDLSGLGFRV